MKAVVVIVIESQSRGTSRFGDYYKFGIKKQHMQSIGNWVLHTAAVIITPPPSCLLRSRSQRPGMGYVRRRSVCSTGRVRKY